MPTIKDTLSEVKIEDQRFIGTIAFKSEKITLPDGSKIAIGIDDGFWVLIHQKPKDIVCYEYDVDANLILVDKKQGSGADMAELNRLIQYFFTTASPEDLVTIIPPKSEII